MITLWLIPIFVILWGLTFYCMTKDDDEQGQ